VTDIAPHQAIYRRWRAQTFGQIVGQEAVVETLRNAVRTGRVAHAVLFVGPRGTGKTSLARILAKALNCTNLQDGDPCDACPSCVAIREGRALDLVEIDAASNRGIDAIRDLRERINYAPTDLRRKVYILDEAHQITRDAWNALLKSLEEPPDFVVFMFASTHPQDFPPAILSRLQRFDVRRLTVDEIEGKLARILDAEGRTAEPGAIRLIATLAVGGMRDAESMLDQLLVTGGERLTEASVRSLLGLADAQTISAFLDALDAGDVVSGIALLDELEDRGRDLRILVDQVVAELRSRLVSAAATGDRQHSGRLAAVARRLAGIDPNRGGAGGLRLQLELALLANPDAAEAPGRPSGASAVAHDAPSPVPPVVAGAASPAAAKANASATTPVGPASAQPRTSKAAAPVSEAAAPTTAAPVPRVATSSARTSPTVSAPPIPPTTPTTSATPPGKAPAAPAEAPRRIGGSGESTATEGSPAGPELARLQELWPGIVASLSAHPPTKPLIAACRPISVADGVVTLGFPEDMGFLRDVAERRRSVLEDGIGAALGAPVAVRCVATNLDVAPPVATDDEAAFILAEARRIFGDDLPEPPEIG
jgi:DNA polymerase-3 subunit gamma/tau